MSSSDSIDASPEIPEPPEHSGSDVDPAIAEAVDGVANRFGAQGLAQMISYAQKAADRAQAALDDLAES